MEKVRQTPQQDYGFSKLKAQRGSLRHSNLRSQSCGLQQDLHHKNTLLLPPCLARILRFKDQTSLSCPEPNTSQLSFKQGLALAGTVQMAMNRQLQILTKFRLNLVGPEVHLLLNKSRFAIGSPARTKASSQDTKILGESMQKLNPDMKRQDKKSRDMEVEEVHLWEPLAGRLVLLIASRARKQGAVDEKGPCGAIPTLG